MNTSSIILIVVIFLDIIGTIKGSTLDSECGPVNDMVVEETDMLLIVSWVPSPGCHQSLFFLEIELNGRNIHANIVRSSIFEIDKESCSEYVITVRSLSTAAMLGAATTLQHFSGVAGQLGPVTLREDTITGNLYVMWSTPSQEDGCIFTVTYTNNAPGAQVRTFETQSLYYVIKQDLLVPCSTATVSVRSGGTPAVIEETAIATRASSAPILVDKITSCDSIEMTWAGQPYQENMCEHTHFQLHCLSNIHNFTIPRQVTDELNRNFLIRLTTVLKPDVFYSCHGYMYVTLAGFTPSSEDIEFWSNLDSVRALEVVETESALRVNWEPPLNSEKCGVAYKVVYRNEDLGEHFQITENLYVDLDIEIIPCADYEIFVIPISYTGSEGRMISIEHTPKITQNSIKDITAVDNGNSITVTWKPINIGRCDVVFFVEHYVDNELKRYGETTDNWINFERIPCSINRFEIRVNTDSNIGVPTLLDLNLAAGDVQTISEVENVRVSGNDVTWDPPVSIGRCGVVYEVIHDGPFGISTNIITSSQVTLNLLPCSENTVTIRGVSGALVGAPVTFNFIADAVDFEAPEILRIIPNFMNASLTMHAESKDVNLCPITEALVSCSKEGSETAFGTAIDVLDNESRMFELDLIGLEADSIYNCRARWSNSPMGSNFRFRTIPLPQKELFIDMLNSSGFTVFWDEDYGMEFVRGYELVINSHGPAHQIKEGCDHETSNMFVFNLDAGYTSLAFKEGFPDYEYDVILVTSYALGSLGVNVESLILNTQTLTDIPGIPENLQVKILNEDTFYGITGVVTWEAPCQLNGALRGFGITVIATFEFGGINQSLEYSLEVEAESPNDIFTYELKNMNPFFTYVIAVNTLADLSGPSSEIVIDPSNICPCIPTI